MKWGVLPRNKTQDAPKTLNTINANIETILEGSYLWSPLVNAKRCVVVCDGYVLLSSSVPSLTVAPGITSGKPKGRANYPTSFATSKLEPRIAGLRYSDLCPIF
jgi:hypothetical protein